MGDVIIAISVCMENHEEACCYPVCSSHSCPIVPYAYTEQVCAPVWWLEFELRDPELKNPKIGDS